MKKTQDTQDLPLNEKKPFEFSCVIEPLILLQCVANNLLSSSFDQFIFTRIYGVLVASNDTVLVHGTDDELRMKAQQQTAHLFFALSLINAIPSIIMTNILGVNCTKIGRKPMLSFTLLVMIIRNVIYFLLAVWPAMPNYLLYICSVLEGLTADMTIFQLTISCYISDITTDKVRSSRLAFISYINILTGICISFVCGYLIKYFGYVHIFSASLAFRCLAFIYTLAFIPESIVSLKSTSIMQRLCTCSLKNTFDSFSVLYKKADSTCSTFYFTDQVQTKPAIVCNTTEHFKRKILQLLLSANMIYVLVMFSIFSVFSIFVMNKPFCWDSVFISNYRTFIMIGSLVTSFTITKCFNTNDIVMCCVSVLSTILACVCFSLAKTTWFVYLGGTMGFLSGLAFTYSRSMISKLVPKDDVSNAMTLMSILEKLSESLGFILGPLLYENLAKINLNQILFAILSLVCVPILVILLYAYYLYRRLKCSNEVIYKAHHHDTTTETDTLSQKV